MAKKKFTLDEKVIEIILKIFAIIGLVYLVGLAFGQ
jgi:hypothetical protein